VIGSRDVADSHLDKRQSFIREFGGKTFNKIVQLFAIRGIKDTQCGFKLFTARAAKEIFEKQRIEGFGFDVEILILAKTAGYEIRETGIRWVNAPDSKVHIILSPLRMLKELFIIRMNLIRGAYK